MAVDLVVVVVVVVGLLVNGGLVVLVVVAVLLVVVWVGIVIPCWVLVVGLCTMTTATADAVRMHPVRDVLVEVAMMVMVVK